MKCVSLSTRPVKCLFSKSDRRKQVKQILPRISCYFYYKTLQRNTFADFPFVLCSNLESIELVDCVKSERLRTGLEVTHLTFIVALSRVLYCRDIHTWWTLVRYGKPWLSLTHCTFCEYLTPVGRGVCVVGPVSLMHNPNFWLFATNSTLAMRRFITDSVCIDQHDSVLTINY